MQDMDWNDLRFALAISRAGSLSGAAQALRVHQTTVGRRLSALEDSLGVALFLRTPGGLLPTAEGAQVLGSIEGLAASLTRFEQRVSAELRGTRGLVRVAITEAGARQLIESTLPGLLRDHPGLVVELVPANAVVDLRRGDADLAVRLVKPDDALVARKLGVVRYGLYASEAYLRRRGAIEGSLDGHDVVLPSRELAKGPEGTWLSRHASSANVVLHATSLVTLALAVEGGMGVTVLPTNLAAMHPRARRVRELTDIAQRPVYLVMHPDARRVPRVRLVADAVAAEIKRRLAD